jgi:hypothetical protein
MPGISDQAVDRRPGLSLNEVGVARRGSRVVEGGWHDA